VTTKVQTVRTRDGRRRVRLHVVVARRGKLAIVVNGPAPSCHRVGVVTVRVRRGGNDVLFGGRVRGKALEPGIYTLTPRLTRTGRAGPSSIVVRVGRRGGVVALGRGAGPTLCGRTTTPLAGDLGTGTGTAGTAGMPGTPGNGMFASTTFAAAPLLDEDGTSKAASATVTKLPAGHGADSADLPRATGGTLGARATHLGQRVVDSFGVVGNIVATALLALIVAALGVSAVLVLRFFRGSWNP
jgi:hypothetical protein